MEFSSKLNSHLQAALEKGGRYEELVKALHRDYSVSKRQYAIYLVDCYEKTLASLCAKADIKELQVAINNGLGDTMFVGIVLGNA